MKRYFNKYIRIVSINILVYHISKPIFSLVVENTKIEKQKISINKTMYYIKKDDKIIHISYLFNSLNVLKLIRKKGPAIGDCFTDTLHRGKSIYPFVINNIANEIVAQSKFPEVFILVNSNNKSSIKGIEKAGFILHSKIVAKRFLFFYFNKKIQYFIQ
jgi:hypothetical protein